MHTHNAVSFYMSIKPNYIHEYTSFEGKEFTYKMTPLPKPQSPNPPHPTLVPNVLQGWFGRQRRSRSDAANRSVWSGFTLFAIETHGLPQYHKLHPLNTN